jgi:signal transduction histidine kinase
MSRANRPVRDYSPFKMVRTAKCLGVLVLIAAVLAMAYAAGDTTGLLLALSGTSLLSAAVLAAILYRQRPANQLLPQRNSDWTPPVPRSQLASAGLQNEGRRHQAELNLEQTLRGLTHESRDALQQGQACLELLALKTRDQPELQELVADIQKALDRLLHLYENARRQCSTNYGGR